MLFYGAILHLFMSLKTKESIQQEDSFIPLICIASSVIFCHSQEVRFLLTTFAGFEPLIS